MEVIRLGKRGIFFTIMALFVVMAIFFYFWTSQPLQVPSSGEWGGGRASLGRAVFVNEYVSSLKESLVKRALAVSAFNAIRAMSAYTVNESVFFTDYSAAFNEIVLNGTINSNPLTSYGIDYMENSTLPHLLELIKNSSEGFLRITMNYSITGVEAYQDNSTGPWQVGAKMNLSVYIDAEVAEWRQNQTISALLPIEGIEDPYYSVNTGKAWSKFIKRTNITKWNLSLLQEFINRREYKYEEKAPSFLLRLENSSASSACCGIESVVYFDSSKNMSFVDYCYFGEKCPGSDPGGNFSLYNVTGITTPTYQFKIEPYHASEEKYNLTDYLVPI